MPREDQDHRFMERYGELKAFIEQNGRRPRAESREAVEAALGRWVISQQTLRNAGNLAENRLKLIEDLGTRLLRGRRMLTGLRSSQNSFAQTEGARFTGP